MSQREGGRRTKKAAAAMPSPTTTADAMGCGLRSAVSQVGRVVSGQRVEDVDGSDALNAKGAACLSWRWMIKV
jgi:hypothetical protein